MTNDELTNLLPPERQKILRRNYFFRLATISMMLGMVLLGVAGILLLPTYVLLSQKESDKKAELRSIEATLSSVNEKELSSRLASLTGNAKVLASFAKTKSATELLTAVLAVPRPGITLDGFGYTPQTTAKSSAKIVQATLTVSGVAATREVLQNYQIALQSVPRVTSAVLPVSAYAQSTQIDFMITLTLAP